MNAVLTFLNQNWFLLVVIISVIVIAVRATKKFSELPSEEQQKKVLEWLFYAVVKAEKKFEAGKLGRIKLRYVYDLFLDKFPSIAPVVSFEQFSKWVDIALDEMRKAIESNPKFKEYIERGEEDEYSNTES